MAQKDQIILEKDLEISEKNQEIKLLKAMMEERAYSK